MVATRGRTLKRPWRRSCHSSKLKSSSAPIGRKDSWCFHAVGSSNAPLLGSTAAEGLPRIGRTSIATRWRSCGLPQSASCSENFVIPPDVFGQTLRLGQPNHSVILALLTGVGRSPALVGCRLSVATYGPCLRGQNPDVARSIRATRGVRDSVRTRMRPVRYAIRSLCGLHPESLRDRGELVADLLNAGGELARAAQIHHLAGLRQPAGNRRIGLDHGADVGGNAL